LDIKVYCKNCKWFSYSRDCKSPANFTKQVDGDWEVSWIKYVYKKLPSSKNQYNDCQDYKRIWGKFWIKEK